jgi:hypothetical protein
MIVIPSTPLSADVDAALTRLEQAKTFDGLDADYALVDQEATKRAVPAFFAMLPAMTLFAALVLGAYAMGWILPDIWGYALWLLIVPFTALVTNAPSARPSRNGVIMRTRTRRVQRHDPS